MSAIKIFIHDKASPKVRIVSVTAESVTIGTHPDADIRLNSDRDRFIFEIKQDEEFWWLINLQKSSRLKLNGKSVPLEQRIESKDEIVIDGHRLVFELEDATGSQNDVGPDFAFRPQNDEALWRYLLDEQEFDEILINGGKKIYVDWQGRLYPSPWEFQKDSFLEEKIRTSAKRDVQDGWFSWRQDRRLRFQAALPPLTDAPYLAIRKFGKKRFSLDDLLDGGFMTEDEWIFLRDALRRKENILITGPTSSGKTVFLRALISELSHEERLVILEEEAEIDWPHPHAISIETGRGFLRKGVVESLRMRPSRLIVSEVRGSEALEMLQALATGHAGGLSTLHASSGREAITRLESLVLTSDNQLSVQAARRLIATSINLILHVERSDDGKRRLNHISRLNGLQNETYLFSNPMQTEGIGITQRSVSAALSSVKKKSS